MSSSSVPVFPINAISYVVDRSITNPGDVMRHFEAFGSSIEAVSVEQWASGPTQVFRLKHQLTANSDVQLYKFSLGRLEISISYDPATTGIMLQTFLSVPIIGTVSVGTVSGSIKEGVSVKLGWGSLLVGEVGARMEDGNGNLYYDFTALGQHMRGEVKIFK